MSEKTQTDNWLCSHVQGHLVFGPLCKHFSFGWLVVIALGTHILMAHRITDGIQLMVEAGALIVLATLSYRMPRQSQAAAGWCMMKITLGACSLVALVAAGLVGYFSTALDGLHLLLLAAIWLPGPEFIPQLLARQKYITAARLAATSLVLYFLLDTTHLR